MSPILNKLSTNAIWLFALGIVVGDKGRSPQTTSSHLLDQPGSAFPQSSFSSFSSVQSVGVKSTPLSILSDLVNSTTNIDQIGPNVNDSVGYSTFTPTKDPLPPLNLNLSVLTWNLAEKAPSEQECDFIKYFRESDIVCLGVQECEDIKPRRHEGHRSRIWKAIQKKKLGKSFECLAQHKMGGIQLSVWAKKRIVKKIHGVHVLDVACGVGNVLTNKGAICVLLRVRGKTLAIINAHLAAHQHKVADRNADYHRIMDMITSRAPKRWLTMGHSRRRVATSAMGTTLGGINSATLNGGILGLCSSDKPWLEQMLSSAGIPPDDRVNTRSDKNTVPMKQQALPYKGKDEEDVHDDRGNRISKGDVRKKVSKNDNVRRKGTIMNKERGGGSKITSSRLAKTKSDKKTRSYTKKIGDTPTSMKSKKMTPPATPPPVFQPVLVEKGREKEKYELPFDGIIFMGDLNYRVDYPRLEFELLKAGVGWESEEEKRRELANILSHDQLKRQKGKGLVFKGFTEMGINFMPTFKYDKGQDSFDSSSKARCPAWTDRILYAQQDSLARSSKPLITQKIYTSIDCRHSDHRPVTGQFDIQL